MYGSGNEAIHTGNFLDINILDINIFILILLILISNFYINILAISVLDIGVNILAKYSRVLLNVSTSKCLDYLDSRTILFNFYPKLPDHDT